MSDEKSRKDFEAWWQSTPILRENKRTLAEKAWQASRAALVIELPLLENFKNDESAHGMLVICRHQIKAAGLKVAP